MHSSSSSSRWPAYLEKDYGYAVLHIATLRLADNNTYILLFARLELIPKEIPRKIKTIKYQTLRFGKNSKRSERIAYIQQITLTVQEALTWYLDCLNGICVLPKNEFCDFEIRPLIFNLSPEPPWPLMTCVDDDSFIPFIGNWHIYPKLHQLVSLSFTFESFQKETLLGDEQIEKLKKFLFDHLHFDIANFSSLWGSINLIVPNPVFREFEHSLKEANSPNGDIIEYRFISREGQELTGLSIIIDEERPCGHSTYIQNVTSSKGEMVIPYQIGHNRIKVLHKEHGLLFAQGLARFIRSITVGDFTDGPSVSLQADTSKDKKQSVAIQSPLQIPKYLSAESRLSAEKRHQDELRKRTIGQDPVQCDFYNDQDSAIKVIKSRISRVRESLLIADPYFSHHQLYILDELAFSRKPARVRILTSAKLLKNHYNPEENLSEEQKQEAAKLPHLGQRLLDALCLLQAKGKFFEVHVVEGDPSPLHDRFICIDGQVHILGNSISGIGKNYSVILISPSPAEIISRLEAFWRPGSIPLNAWIAKRRSEKC